MFDGGTTYKDHYRLKPSSKPGGYEPGGRAKYDAGGAPEGHSSLKSRERGRANSKESAADQSETVFIDSDSNGGRRDERKSVLNSTNAKATSLEGKSELTREAVIYQEKDPERTPEDLGPPSVFYPLTPDWQRSKANKLNINVVRTLNFGTQKRFYSTTPPRKTEPVRGDGNCFFRAICALITGSESDHMTVRKAVTQHVADNPNMYRSFLESRGGMTKYLSSMKQSREWATDTEIMATATLLKTVVMVYFPYQVGSRLEYRWQTFKPLDNPDITFPVIYLINKNEHFEPVLDVERDTEPSQSGKQSTDSKPSIDSKASKDSKSCIDPKSDTKVGIKPKSSWNKF